jgi:phosphoribosylaminoimidazolecarboxamide formyltransferase/IMP cyclohydrolase
MIKRALLTVYDKTGIVDLAIKLKEFDIEIVSTGGTMKELRHHGIDVKSVTDITGFPEILDGRVKTLHPKVHGGILARRDKGDHISALNMHNIPQFDLVVVNLYPFESVVASGDVTEEEALENIDIGGPSMIRSSAKNFPHVTVITTPDDYQPFIENLSENNGSTSLEFRKEMAYKAFARTSEYDGAIKNWFEGNESEFPPSICASYNLKSTLRYGENPHQKAALYAIPGYKYSSIAQGKLLSGKELSFNNIWDLEAALQMVLDFKEPFAAVIKHTNPCGAAVADSLDIAYQKALYSDPLSAFGSIIALNRKVDMKTAEHLDDTPFIECILAPGYDDSSLELLKKKKNRRLLDIGEIQRGPGTDFEFRPIAGGILAQSADLKDVTTSDLEIVTEVKPTENQIKELLFAFKIVKHIKSNAIVICKDLATIGVGAGQTSRVDSSIIAVRKSGDRIEDSVAASDAFFPMPDGLETLAEAGVKAVIQPGGSKKDPDVIEAANRLGIAMVLTGVRHFKH